MHPWREISKFVSFELHLVYTSKCSVDIEQLSGDNMASESSQGIHSKPIALN